MKLIIDAVGELARETSWKPGSEPPSESSGASLFGIAGSSLSVSPWFTCWMWLWMISRRSEAEIRLALLKLEEQLADFFVVFKNVERPCRTTRDERVA
jgi:hypothetical protein